MGKKVFLGPKVSYISPLKLSCKYESYLRPSAGNSFQTSLKLSPYITVCILTALKPNRPLVYEQFLHKCSYQFPLPSLFWHRKFLNKYYHFQGEVHKESGGFRPKTLPWNRIMLMIKSGNVSLYFYWLTSRLNFNSLYVMGWFFFYFGVFLNFLEVL